MDTAVSDAAALTVWAVSLGLGAVVIAVVALLLHLILRTGRAIEGGAEAIWTEGKLVANNTIQIPLFLTTTNDVARRILATAVQIAGGAQAIAQHAEGCPGCPACVLQTRE